MPTSHVLIGGLLLFFGGFYVGMSYEAERQKDREGWPPPPAEAPIRYAQPAPNVADEEPPQLIPRRVRK